MPADGARNREAEKQYIDHHYKRITEALASALDVAVAGVKN